jgi:hypothetical protein
MVDSNQTRRQDENGVSDKTLLDPAAWTRIRSGTSLQREYQADLMYDHGRNIPLYLEVQALTSTGSSGCEG